MKSMLRSTGRALLVGGLVGLVAGVALFFALLLLSLRDAAGPGVLGSPFVWAVSLLGGVGLVLDLRARRRARIVAVG